MNTQTCLFTASICLFLTIANYADAQCTFRFTRTDDVSWYLSTPSAVTGLGSSQYSFANSIDFAVDACCCEAEDLHHYTDSDTHTGFGSVYSEASSATASVGIQSAPSFALPNRVVTKQGYFSGLPSSCELVNGLPVRAPAPCCIPGNIQTAGASGPANYQVNAPTQWHWKVRRKIEFAGCIPSAIQRESWESTWYVFLLRMGATVQVVTDLVDPNDVPEEGDILFESLSGTLSPGTITVESGIGTVADTLRGDADGDGIIEFCDLIEIQATIASGQVKFGDAGYSVNADASLNGSVDSADDQYLRALLSLIPGDVNGDFYVNSSDFSIIASNYSQGPGKTRAQGDLSGDGYVNAADMNILATNYLDGYPDSHPECF